MGIAALILGILGVVIPGYGILFAITALVLGIIAVKKNKQKKLGLVGLILGGIGILLLPILAAIAIPAFIKFENKSKEAEALSMLDKMYFGASNYLDLPQYDAQGQQLNLQLPPSVDWTPAASCCEQTGGEGRCDPLANQAAWQHPTWQALEFEVVDQFFYQYRFVNEGNQVLFQAQGDLDCDGETSLITLRATVQPDGSLQRAPTYEKQRELE